MAAGISAKDQLLQTASLPIHCIIDFETASGQVFQMIRPSIYNKFGKPTTRHSSKYYNLQIILFFLKLSIFLSW